MRTRGDKRTSRKHDRKVLVAEESTKSWVDTDSESSSSSSSSSDSEQEEVHCFMADRTSDYEEVKAENISLKSSSIESSSDELEDIDSLKIELRKLTAENDLLRNESSELKAEGCPAIIYEAALTEFFANGSVRDGLVVSTIKGKAVEIFDEVFAATFELPTEGLTDFSEVPKELLFDARSLFSISKEQVSISCLKNEMKIEYRLLSDILAKTIYVKAGSFDAVTRERFMLMTAITFDVKVNWIRMLFDVLNEMVTPGSRHAKGYAIQISVLLKNIPGLELGESRAFPIPRVLNEKMVHRYVVINEKIGGTEIPDSPMLKKTPAKKAVSQKRPAVDTAMSPVVKKRRTTKGKPVTKETVDAPVEQPPAPQRKIQKRKRRLILEIDDEINVEEQTAIDNLDEQVGKPVDEQVAGQPEVVPVAEATTDDPDAIIEQVLDQLDSVATIYGEDQPAVTGAEEIHWFDLPYEDLMARLDAERPVVTAMSSGSVVGNEQLQLVEEAAEEMSADSEKAVDERIDTDEAMSLEDILMTIPVNVPLPYLTSLPQIPVDDKGKEILVEKDPVKGNPAKEHYSLICADIDLLVHLRAQVIGAVDQLFHSLSFKKLATINVEEMAKKEEQVLYWGETETIRVALNRKMYILLKYREVLVRKFLESWKQNFVPGEGSSATDLKVINMLSNLHLFVLEELKEQALAHGLRWEKTCCSRIFEVRIHDRGAVIARSNSNTKSSCWIRTMIRVDGVWTFEPCGDQWVKIPRPIVQNEVHRQCSYVDSLSTISEFFKILRKRWAYICIEAVEFFVSGRLLPVGSINFCRSLSVDGPVYRVAPRQSTVFALRVSHVRPGIVIENHRWNESINRSSAGLRSLFECLSCIFGFHFVCLAILEILYFRIFELRLDPAERSVALFCLATGYPTAGSMRCRLTQQTLNIITDQLSELVAYINRGGNDKKGEVSSSRPPPDDQNRGSGNTGGGGDTVRTTYIPQRDIDNAQRNILERLMSADRAKERERRSKSKSGSGSYKRIR
ncbi:hypothetical protein F511_41311 [Dorcoceras hygrometricum]|uniref:Uncharacterized protein n=1 Tax=Dorcoceras hygrometricum TaxID=472368 RepID=A0A2Z7AUX4_9LAMI|nr:hypothetical protein F511_41311 [Dorcoceras hygrometricum]